MAQKTALDDWRWLAADVVSAGTRQRGLFAGIRTAILAGRLKAGERLPATRALAADLGLARNTVLQVYERLQMEGYVMADRRGSRVASLPLKSSSAQSPEANDQHLFSQRAQAMIAPELGNYAEVMPFASGLPEVSRFPFRAWRSALDHAWREAKPAHLAYGAPGGEWELRQTLADYLRASRGLDVAAEQVIVIAGSQVGFDLCARLLADEGDKVWVEDPGYLAARSAFRLAGLRLHRVPVDAEGASPQASDWVKYRPRLILLTPSHQYPTGHPLSLRRRLDWLQKAETAGAWIVEDDWGCEFGNGVASTLSPLFALQSGARSIYVGSFSKTLYPGLRLGYLVVPKALAAAFGRAAAQVFRPGQGIEQVALAHFIQRGDYARHLRRMRQCYAERCTALLMALARHFGEGFSVTGQGAGLHLCLWLPPECPDVQVVVAARLQGVSVRALSAYAIDATGINGLVLGYASAEPALIDSAVRRLRQACTLVMKAAR